MNDELKAVVFSSAFSNHRSSFRIHPFLSLCLCVSVVDSVDRKAARRLASLLKLKTDFASRRLQPGFRCILDINDEAKEIVQDLGAAINSAVEKSTQVAEAIERLREAGYEMELTLRLEIALRQHSDDEEAESEDTTLELTDEDMRTLRRMKIRIDESE
jgi:hypothetical protein